MRDCLLLGEFVKKKSGEKPLISLKQEEFSVPDLVAARVSAGAIFEKWSGSLGRRGFEAIRLELWLELGWIYPSPRNVYLSHGGTMFPEYLAIINLEKPEDDIAEIRQKRFISGISGDPRDVFYPMVDDLVRGASVRGFAVKKVRVFGLMSGPRV